MFAGPTKKMADCVCPCCNKRYAGTISLIDPPAKRGKRYLLRCWNCCKINKSKWAQDWIDTFNKMNGE